ncbi:MAG TPA: hypothetical protein VN872_07810 [Candidatus Acidoferrum sp.]|nr:hypothetical protein [Candidatus Acidoferrum sp.]
MRRRTDDFPEAAITACIPSGNVPLALLADSTTLGFAISEVTLERTSAGDFL